MAERGLTRRRAALGSVLAFALGACDRPDVDERVELRLANDGRSVVEFSVEFPDSVRDIEDEARRDRLTALQQGFLNGWDRWAPRFESAGRAGETLAWERIDGELRRLTRTAALETPEQLADFFADTDLTVQFRPDPAESELAIFAASSSRATREQRRRLAADLTHWSDAVVVYLRQVADLYAYLDSNEERAEDVIRAIFDDAETSLTESEDERLERLLDSLWAVLEIADRSSDGGESLERLARLVYDPFPARLSATFEGALLGSEGFVPKADGSYEIPPLGLELALAELEERWIQPPLLTTYERVQRLETRAGFDAAEFALRPRRVRELPAAEDVARAVGELLEPETEYRLRWRPAPAPSE